MVREQQREIDPEYLRYQYGDGERLRIREETHRLYSERPNDWIEWVVAHAEIEPGQLVIDVGCGAGFYHAPLAKLGARTVALDTSWGMLVESQQGAYEGGFVVSTVQADAQELPIVDSVADRVMANHMLYHVPDQRRALCEIRRVLRPSGRVVLATVAADQNGRIRDLHAEVARQYGLTPTGGVGTRFTLDDLPLVHEVFPDARAYVREDAFVFHAVEPALRYYGSGFVDGIVERDPDGAHRPRLIEAMREQIEAIIAGEGVFRVAKNAGCFVASV